LIEKQSTGPRDIDYFSDHNLHDNDEIDSTESCKELIYYSQSGITAAPTTPVKNQLNLFDGSITLSLAYTGSKAAGDFKYDGKYSEVKSTRCADNDNSYSRRQGKKVQAINSNNLDEPDVEVATESGSSKNNDDCLDVGLFLDEGKFK
jgi:hypothetical protein